MRNDAALVNRTARRSLIRIYCCRHTRMREDTGDAVDGSIDEQWRIAASGTSNKRPGRVPGIRKSPPGTVPCASLASLDCPRRVWMRVRTSVWVDENASCYSMSHYASRIVNNVGLGYRDTSPNRDDLSDTTNRASCNRQRSYVVDCETQRCVSRPRRQCRLDGATGRCIQ